MSSRGEDTTPEVVVVSIMASIIKAADMLVTVMANGDRPGTFWTDEFVAEKAWGLFIAVRDHS